MTTRSSSKYNVGGIMMERPFKIRRLGHFGFNAVDMEGNAHFYQDLLGFKVSAEAGRGFFGRYGSDHHAMVIFDREATDARVLGNPKQADHYRVENDINQITWQVQSIDEVWQATKYFKDMEIQVRTEGRAGNGSNYHLYVWDPDQQIDELYYGIEQIGWDGHSKPREFWRGIPEATMQPNVSEFDEIQEELAKGSDPLSGYRYDDKLEAKYDVDGTLLPRPFKITRIGPVNLFCDSVEAAREYYTEILGFKESEQVEWQGEKAAFLRCDIEHHSLGLYPKSWRSKLGLSETTSNMSFGMQLANYRQLRNAIDFLRENGVRVETAIVPPELNPGIDYAAYAFDPDGHAIMLYYYMETVGGNGQVRPSNLRRKVDLNNWPETLEPLSDSFKGEPFMGPWG